MEEGERLSLEQIRAFLEASEEVGSKAGIGRRCTGGWTQTLRQQHYEELERASRGLVRRLPGRR